MDACGVQGRVQAAGINLQVVSAEMVSMVFKTRKPDEIFHASVSQQG